MTAADKPCLSLQFGAGHRVCLGKNVSYLEIYKLVPTMLRKYEVSVVQSFREKRGQPCCWGTVTDFDYADILCRSGPTGVEREEPLVSTPVQLQCKTAAACGRLGQDCGPLRGSEGSQSYAWTDLSVGLQGHVMSLFRSPDCFI